MQFEAILSRLFQMSSGNTKYFLYWFEDLCVVLVKTTGRNFVPLRTFTYIVFFSISVGEDNCLRYLWIFILYSLVSKPKLFQLSMLMYVKLKTFFKPWLLTFAFYLGTINSLSINTCFATQCLLQRFSWNLSCRFRGR